MVCISCYVTNTKMKHRSQQEVIIITWTWLLGTSYPGTIAFHSEKHKPLQSTHLEQNLIQGISIYQNVVTSTDEVMGKILT